MVPSKTLDGSAILCVGVPGVEVSSMSELAVLASARFIGVGVLSSPECAASPSESSSFQAELWKGVSTSIWLVASRCCRMANLLRELEWSVMPVVPSVVGECEFLLVGIVCHAGSGGGPVDSEDCQVLPTAFWKIIIALSFPVARIRNGPFSAPASST